MNVGWAGLARHAATDCGRNRVAQGDAVAAIQKHACAHENWTVDQMASGEASASRLMVGEAHPFRCGRLYFGLVRGPVGPKRRAAMPWSGRSFVSI